MERRTISFEKAKLMKHPSGKCSRLTNSDKRVPVPCGIYMVLQERGNVEHIEKEDYQVLVPTYSDWDCS